MGEWSPECQRCEWIDGAVGPAVGARFKGRNRRGIIRWSTTPRVHVADAGREFTFVTGHRGRDMTKWTYRFDPLVNGTTVTESFEMLPGTTALPTDTSWASRIAPRTSCRTGGNAPAPEGCDRGPRRFALTELNCRIRLPLGDPHVPLRRSNRSKNGGLQG
jgi:hypothetical protein